MWEKNKVLIIEEELLNGEELLDAAQEAIVQHGFTITESFAARVRPRTRFPSLNKAVFPQAFSRLASEGSPPCALQNSLHSTYPEYTHFPRRSVPGGCPASVALQVHCSVQLRWKPSSL